MLASDILKQALIRHGYGKRKAYAMVEQMRKLPEYALFLNRDFSPDQAPKQAQILEMVFHLPITAVEALALSGEMLTAAKAKKN